MWKWIVGVALFLVVLLVGTCWLGYRKLTSGGASATVAIAATPDRVFASLADPDSMAVWMATGSTVTSVHHGVVTVGDTLHIETGTSGRARQQYTWIVSAVTPGQLLVLDMRVDTSKRVFATRRDSLVTAGDSTMVITTIASPMIDSMRTQRGDTSGKVGGALLDFGSKVVISAFRVMSERDLERLKARLEGRPMPAN
ncbi:MAG: SRPBCC family protein [Gemmatimonadales bacterium]